MDSKNTFVGQEKQWEALARAFAKGSVPQTLLISGPPQTGKRALARRYAQLLLCPNTVQVPVTESSDSSALPAPCGECRVCHQVEIETFPDFRVYRPLVSEAREEKDWVIAPNQLIGSIITIAVARKFGDEAMRKPLVGPRKVMIIEQAERMNIEAQNALLKTFEEPVPGLSIVFLCDNPLQLLATVRSRCWHLPLGLVADQKISTWLRERFPDTSPAFIEEAVRMAAGRPGLAERALLRLQNPEAVAEKEDKASKEKGATEPSRPRSVHAQALVDRIARSQPVGALGLTEEALRLARLWWDEDRAFDPGPVGKGELKKGEAKILRSAVAAFLDELAAAYRARWMGSVSNATSKTAGGGRRIPATVWADGLDQIRKTRQYILRNANTNLALDVLFGSLIAHQLSTRQAMRRS